MRYKDDEGKVREFQNKAPDVKDHQHAGEKAKHDHSCAHFDEPATVVIDLFKNHDELKMVGECEEFTAHASKHGCLRNTMGSFVKKAQAHVECNMKRSTTKIVEPLQTCQERFHALATPSKISVFQSLL